MIVRNIFWDFLGKFFNQGISFIISIFLARILSPSEFGLIAMVMVMVAFARVFADMGLTTAVIQSKDVTKQAISTVFWIIFSISCIMTVLFYSLSAPISRFYNEPDLVPIVQYLSIIFVIVSFTSFQRVQLIKQLQFKTMSLIAVVSNLIAGVIALLLVYQDWGVLALVCQRLLSVILSGIILFFYARWLPSLEFSLKSIRSLLSFGGKTIINRGLTTFFNQMDVVMIGKFFSSYTLGFYTRAKSFDVLVGSLSADSLTAVFFPTISSIQDQKLKVRSLFLKALQMVGLVSVFLSGLLFCVSADMFDILFIKKWSYSGELFQIMAITSFVYPLSSVMVNLIVGLGFAGLNLKASLFKNSVSILPLLAGYFWGIKVFLIGLLLKNLYSLIINMIYVNKATSIKFMTQVNQYASSIIFGVISAILPWLVDIENIYLGIIVDSLLFTAGYVGLIYIYNYELIDNVKEIILKGKAQLTGSNNTPEIELSND